MDKQDAIEVIEINGKKFVPKESIVQYERRKEGPWQVGEGYFIRTVTMALQGTLVDVTANELVLAKAAWIADTGRFSNFVNGAEPGEVEPFPSEEVVIVGRNALIDAVRMNRTFQKQK